MQESRTHFSHAGTCRSIFEFDLRFLFPWDLIVLSLFVALAVCRSLSTFRPSVRALLDRSLKARVTDRWLGFLAEKGRLFDFSLLVPTG